ncbi:MAG TPA: nucleotidyltransferase domain-containing protein [Candidatus Omnitrophota bacterium]|nr:nucleotidyltransferase domain-containing protein [Candidatus Omnitrophota bacterium]
MLKINNLPPVLRNSGVRENLSKICEANDVVFLAIFGSYVRGEQKKASDIDIAIEYDSHKNKSLLDLVHLEYELRKVFKKKVDLGTLSSLSLYIRDDVKKEMKVVYEKR